MEWGALLEKAKEGGFTTTILPDGEYNLEVIGRKVRKSGTNQQLIVTLRVLDGPYVGQEVPDFLTFSDAAGGIAFQKIERAGGGPDFLQRLSSDFGSSVTEAGVKFIGESIFPDGKKFLVTAKTSTNGKNNNFTIKEVLSDSVSSVPTPAPVAAPVSAPVAPVANPYAAPPTSNPNLPV